MSKNRGFTLIEIMIALAVFSMIAFVIVRLYGQTQTSIRKSQQLTNLQQLAKVSLNEIAREIRQTLKVRDIPIDSNFALASDGSNQLCIELTKPSDPMDDQIADRIIYRIGTYNGRPNRLVQQLTTFKRNMSGDVIEDVSYPAIPIVTDMDSYRLSPGGEPKGPLIELFNNSHYSYDNVTFYWDYRENYPRPGVKRGVMALGLTVSVRDGAGRVQNRLTLTTVITSRPITGVPR